MQASFSLLSAIPSLGKGVSRKLALTVVVLAAAYALAAPPQKTAASRTKTRLATAIDLTLEKGFDAVLPPHVSDLLGISPEKKEVPVKQSVEMGEPVRGFDVSTADHNNVVLFVDSPAQKEATYYLTSRTGVLRRVLEVREGVGYPRPSTKDDKIAFAKEKKFWIDRLVPER